VLWCAALQGRRCGTRPHLQRQRARGNGRSGSPWLASGGFSPTRVARRGSVRSQRFPPTADRIYSICRGSTSFCYWLLIYTRFSYKEVYFVPWSNLSQLSLCLH